MTEGEHPDEQRLDDLVRGRLTGAPHAAVLAHLEHCARCRELSVVLGQDRSKELPAVSGDGGDPLIGTRLGEYRVTERLSEGGMGRLYRGVQPEIGKRVAIKVLLPELAEAPELVNRLMAEARAVNAIRHPNIIDIFGFGRLPDGRHYFVMDLLEGHSLHERITRGPVAPNEAISILDQAAAALEAAHAVNVVHRDIKPANLFISAGADGALHVTLLDFGIAKRLGHLGETSPNIVLGTPGFMAPEQLRGEPVSAETDIYALGVVAFVMLSGREPFGGENTKARASAQLDEDPPKMSDLVGVPRPLEVLVEWMMARNHSDRPSASEVRRQLGKLKGMKKQVETVRIFSPLMSIDALRKPRPAAPAAQPWDAASYATTKVRPAVQHVTHEMPSPDKVTGDVLAATRRTEPELAAQALITVPDRVNDTHEVQRATLPHPGQDDGRRRWLWLLGALAVTLTVGGVVLFIVAAR